MPEHDEAALDALRDEYLADVKRFNKHLSDMNPPRQKGTLAFIGTGRLGGEVAFLAARHGFPIEKMVFHDINEAQMKAQIADITDAVGDIDISTDPDEIKDADVCIYTAGVPRNPMVQTRKDLLTINAPIAKDCVEFCKKFKGLWITVTNPVDALNYYFARANGHEKRFLGFGCQIDTQRLQTFLDAKYGFNTRGGVVIGEHGEYYVPIIRPEETDDTIRAEAVKMLQDAPRNIIKGKGGTIFGPAHHIAKIVETLFDPWRWDTWNSDGSRVELPCAMGPVSIVKGDISIGTMAVITLDGVISCQNDSEMNEWEREMYRKAEESIRSQIKTVLYGLPYIQRRTI